jgi:hypothetical protein
MRDFTSLGSSRMRGGGSAKSEESAEDENDPPGGKYPTDEGDTAY